MESTETPQRTAARKAADELQALVHTDTAFGDLYLHRARELLGSHLGEADFRALSIAQTEADLLPDRIRGAMGIQDWKVVQDLSGRLATLKRRLQETQEIRAVAQKVYDLDEVLIDPFSPGLRALAGVPANGLSALRDAGLRRLDQLRGLDPGWGEFYDAREKRLRSVLVGGGEETSATQGAGPGQLEAQALQALARGDLKAVQEISARLQKGAGAAAVTPGGRPPSDGIVLDLTHVFPDPVLRSAGRIGLAPVHLESIRLDVEDLFRNAWRPRTAGADGEGGGPVRLSVSLPSDVPEALRDHLEMYLDRPFVNSAGGRYLPPLGDEDLLVEDFDEPPPGSPPVNRPLLELLGLDRRTGLSRVQIERALLAHGVRAVEEAGLDPRAFRLLCIPPDVYVRVGLKRGWGTQPQWTHMDGYMLQNRKWLALAGGDVRFGGVFDLVGLGRENDLENLTTRFAVVQRRRLSAWPVAAPESG
jgi:hypothetical protein